MKNYIIKIDGDSVNSKLSSIYSRNAILKFIPKTQFDVSGENVKNVEFDYIDINGETKTKNSGECKVVPTGHNIYDWMGNVTEWVLDSIFDEEYRWTL